MSVNDWRSVSIPNQEEGCCADGLSRQGEEVSAARMATLAVLVKRSLHFALYPTLSPWGPQDLGLLALTVTPEPDTVAGAESKVHSPSPSTCPLHLHLATFGGQLTPEVPTATHRGLAVSVLCTGAESSFTVVGSWLSPPASRAGSRSADPGTPRRLGSFPNAC